jgi:hypothetical protein
MANLEIVGKRGALSGTGDGSMFLICSRRVKLPGLPAQGIRRIERRRGGNVGTNPRRTS